MNLNLRRLFQWIFILTDTKKAIIGADFLHKLNFLVDILNHKLVDNVTSLSTIGISSSTEIYSVKACIDDQSFVDILRKFPNVTIPQTLIAATSHQTLYYIETKGPPL